MVTCPKCGARLSHSENLMGCYDGSAQRGNTGLSCWSCGYWKEVVHITMPEIPAPDRPFTKSAEFVEGIRGRLTTRQVVNLNLPAIKFWLFNNVTVKDCCVKLAKKGHNISAPTLAKHLRKISALEVK